MWNFFGNLSKTFWKPFKLFICTLRGAERTYFRVLDVYTHFTYQSRCILLNCSISLSISSVSIILPPKQPTLNPIDVRCEVFYLIFVMYVLLGNHCSLSRRIRSWCWFHKSLSIRQATIGHKIKSKRVFLIDGTIIWKMLNWYNDEYIFRTWIFFQNTGHTALFRIIVQIRNTHVGITPVRILQSLLNFDMKEFVC